jgi:hypothetical protein
MQKKTNETIINEQAIEEKCLFNNTVRLKLTLLATLNNKKA